MIDFTIPFISFREHVIVYKHLLLKMAKTSTFKPIITK